MVCAARLRFLKTPYSLNCRGRRNHIPHSPLVLNSTMPYTRRFWPWHSACIQIRVRHIRTSKKILVSKCVGPGPSIQVVQNLARPHRLRDLFIIMGFADSVEIRKMPIWNISRLLRILSDVNMDTPWACTHTRMTRTHLHVKMRMQLCDKVRWHWQQKGSVILDYGDNDHNMLPRSSYYNKLNVCTVFLSYFSF